MMGEVKREYTPEIKMEKTDWTYSILLCKSQIFFFNLTFHFRIPTLSDKLDRLFAFVADISQV